MDRIKRMYIEMAESAIADYAARNYDGWIGNLEVYAKIGIQIQKLLSAGFTPVSRFEAGGYTWTAPAGFSAPWLYSDRSTGKYAPNPWKAAKMSAESATFKAIVGRL